MKRTMIVLGAALCAAVPAVAQAPDSLPVIERRRLSGPRLGAMFAGSGTKPVSRGQVRSIMMAFGWTFEQLVQPSPAGPSLVVQEVVLVGGVEQQALVVVIGALVGVRTVGGFDIGIGPSVGSFGLGISAAVGQSIRWGDVVIPISLSIGQAEGGMRTSLTIGYAFRRR